MDDPRRRRGRRSIRLPNYDYAGPGDYFVTVCIHGWWCALGTVEESAVRLSPAGRMVESAWCALERPGVALDAFVVMPNHVHGALRLDGSCEKTLGGLIGSFKTRTTREYGVGVRSAGWPSYREKLWQRDFHERVIRDDHQFDAIREYIAANPFRWNSDPLFRDR